jgi:Cu-Zn family superoxide dismutase
MDRSDPGMRGFAAAPGAMPPQGEHGQHATAPQLDRAVCVLVPVGDSGVQGVIEFERQGGGKIKITGEVSGLEPGKHGFHVHQYGDLTDLSEGKSAGDHFAGDSSHHGAPDADQRHVGDLGNIEANGQGVAQIDMTDDVIALSGPNSILGRALVVHADPDDFSQPSGGAGGRVAFGVIGMAQK